VNPFKAEYEAALQPYLAADEELQAFTRSSVRDRLAELDQEQAVEEIRTGLGFLLRGCETYAANIDGARAVIENTGLNGQDLAYDSQVEEWRTLAEAALDSEITPVRLSDQGQWKVDRHG
jgi:hypothetical protein